MFGEVDVSVFDDLLWHTACTLVNCGLVKPYLATLSQSNVEVKVGIASIYAGSKK